MAAYNCTNDTINAYGSGGYGTCTGQSVGAPNTGAFSDLVSGAGVQILAPLVAALILASALVLIVRRRIAGWR